MTVARAEVDFLKPIFYPATVNVYTRAARIGTKSWALEHELRDAATDDMLARCTTILVHFEHKTGTSSPIPDEIVTLIEAHEGRVLRNGSNTQTR